MYAFLQEPDNFGWCPAIFFYRHKITVLINNNKNFIVPMVQNTVHFNIS